MRLIALTLALTWVAPVHAATRHRRRPPGKAIRQALRRAARTSPARGPLGAPGDGHQLVVERGTLRLDGRPLVRDAGPVAPSLRPRAWSIDAALGPPPPFPADDRRGPAGTPTPPGVLVARW